MGPFSGPRFGPPKQFYIFRGVRFLTPFLGPTVSGSSRLGRRLGEAPCQGLVSAERTGGRVGGPPHFGRQVHDICLSHDGVTNILSRQVYLSIMLETCDEQHSRSALRDAPIPCVTK